MCPVIAPAPPPQMYIRRRGSSILTPYRPEMLKKILFVVSVLAVARAQIPSLGWCPEYSPMPDFDMSKFLGVWYEAERYFQLSEVVSRCVMANYTQGLDGKLRVSNEVTNRFTGIKRILEGEIKVPATKTEQGKLHVRYTTVPLTPETQYSVLATDYKNYSILWSCTGIGPVHAQNAWVMTRSRRPSNEVLQKAYGVLDNYKISKTFFVKTDQDDCYYLDNLPEIEKPAEKPAKKPTKKPAKKPTTEVPAVEEEVEEEVVEEEVEGAPAAKSVFGLRLAITPDAPEIILETRKKEIAAAAAAAADSVVEPEGTPEVLSAEPIVEEPEKQSSPVEKPAEAEIVVPPASVPEVILKTADLAKEISKESEAEEKNEKPIEKIDDKPAEQSQDDPKKPAKQFADAVQQIQDAFSKPVQQLQEAFNKPVQQFQEAINKPVQQFQDFIADPVNQFQAAFEGPIQQFQAVFQQKPEEPAAQPAETAADAPKDALNDAAAVAVETLPEAIKEPEAPKEEKNEESEKKIES